MSAQEALQKLASGNYAYTEYGRRTVDISAERRKLTADHGQKPYAVIVTCSDSRVPPEHIFSAGIGDLFVIRTAGNVIGDFELGSVEYGAEHLGAKVVVVMGHSGCGAVGAALSGHGAEGSLATIVNDIKNAIGTETVASTAEDINIKNNVERVKNSPVIKHLSDVSVIGAKYDLHSGKVSFWT